jgi:ribose transport system permease protein
VLATGVEGLQLASGAQWLGDMFNGVALIVAVGMAVLRQRFGGRGVRWLVRPRRPPNTAPYGPSQSESQPVTDAPPV